MDRGEQRAVTVSHSAREQDGEHPDVAGGEVGRDEGGADSGRTHPPGARRMDAEREPPTQGHIKSHQPSVGKNAANGCDPQTRDVRTLTPEQSIRWATNV